MDDLRAKVIALTKAVFYKLIADYHDMEEPELRVREKEMQNLLDMQKET